MSLKLSVILGRIFLIITLVASAGSSWADGHDSFDDPPPSDSSAADTVKNMEGRAFVVPPKSISDIEQILNSRQTNDPKRAETDRLLIAEGEPEVGTKSERLAQYIERADAFERMGRSSGLMRNLKAASKLFDSSSVLRSDVVVRALGIKMRFAMALIENGLFDEGLEEVRTVQRWTGRINLRMTKARLISETAYLQALSGRHKEAEESAREAIDGYINAGNTNFYAQNTYLQHLTECIIERMQGTMSWLRGENQKSIKFLRSSKEACKSYYETGGVTGGQYSVTSASVEPRSYRGERMYRQVIDLYVDALVSAGRSLEAESVIREAIKSSLSSTGPNSILTTNHLLSLSSVLLAQGRLKDAGTIAGKIIGLHEAAGFSDKNTSKLKAHLVKARSLAGQGLWREAGFEFSFIQESIGGKRSVLTSSLRKSPAYGLALSYSGKHIDAEKLLSGLVKLNESALGDKSITTALSKGALGVALKRSGKSTEAKPLLEEVLPVIASHSRKSTMESTMDAEFNQWKKIVYEAYLDELAKRFAKTKDPAISARAFEIAQLSAGGSVQRAFAASSARASADNSELSAVIRKYQDLVQRSKNLNGLLLSRINKAGGEESEEALNTLRKQISDIKTAQESMADDIEERFPDYSNLMNPKPVSLEVVKGSLASDEALIVTHVGREKTYVWAIPKAGAAAFSASDLGRKVLQKDVGSLRRSLNPLVETLDDIPEFNVILAGKIYSELLQPVSGGWKNAKNLLVVPSGPLGQLPFSVLVTKDTEVDASSETYFANYKNVPFLVKSHAVTVVPSVSSLIALRNLPSNKQKRKNFIGIGDPFFSKEQALEAEEERQSLQIATRGGITVRGLPIRLRAAPKLGGVATADIALLPRLPDTADEVMGIARVSMADLEKDVFLGRDANEEKLKELDLAKYKIIVFATHGLMSGDLDGLTEPALALTSPAVSGKKGDGLLTLGEILALKLDADWVVLSACNTASADGETSEAMSGLARAFFYAGARALLVSNWPVETISAKKLTTDIFRRQADNPSLSRAQALRRSMVKLLDGPGFTDEKGKTLFAYAHPIFWAPFALVGDGGALTEAKARERAN
jgi:CHAT domain-containing protein